MSTHRDFLELLTANPDWPSTRNCVHLGEKFFFSARPRPWNAPPNILPPGFSIRTETARALLLFLCIVIGWKATASSLICLLCFRTLLLYFYWLYTTGRMRTELYFGAHAHWIILRSACVLNYSTERMRTESPWGCAYAIENSPAQFVRGRSDFVWFQAEWHSFVNPTSCRRSKAIKFVPRRFTLRLARLHSIAVFSNIVQSFLIKTVKKWYSTRSVVSPLYSPVLQLQ